MPLLPATCLSLFPSDLKPYHLPSKCSPPHCCRQPRRAADSRSSQQPEPAWIPHDEWGWQNRPSSDGPCVLCRYCSTCRLAGCWSASPRQSMWAVSPLWCPLGVLGIVSVELPKCQWGKKLSLHMAQLLSSYSEAYPKTRIRDDIESSLYSFTFKILCYREFKTSVRVDNSKMDPHPPISPVQQLLASGQS